MIKKYEDFIKIFEFNKYDKNLLKEYNDLFQIGFEIELDKDDNLYSEIPKNYSRGFVGLNQDLLKEYMPNFYDNWKHIIDITEDMTLGINGFEIVSKPISGFDIAKEFVEDFFNDFNKQKLFKFDYSTGIHINISIKNSNEFNYMKMLLFLSEGIEEKPGYSYKKFEHRIENNFCKPVKKRIYERIKSKAINFNVDEYNKIIKSFFHNKAIIKTCGVVVKGMNNNPYIEFRYIGGDGISMNNIIEKLEYFCYLTLLSKTDLKKESYMKKLYKFNDNLIIPKYQWKY